MGSAGLSRNTAADASISRPSSSASTVKSARVQRWMLVVDHQGAGSARVSGMRPPQARDIRTRQWPKLGKLTSARSPSRAIASSTARGFFTACRVSLRMT